MRSLVPTFIRSHDQGSKRSWHNDLASGSHLPRVPRLQARVLELPTACHVCGLTLVSSPHLARSYHHLFPVRPFQEVSPAELAGIKVRVWHKPSAI